MLPFFALFRTFVCSFQKTLTTLKVSMNKFLRQRLTLKLKFLICRYKIHNFKHKFYKCRVSQISLQTVSHKIYTFKVLISKKAI